jgi:hypothetical protein
MCFVGYLQKDREVKIIFWTLSVPTLNFITLNKVAKSCCKIFYNIHINYFCSNIASVNFPVTVYNNLMVAFFTIMVLLIPQSHFIPLIIKLFDKRL